MSGGHPPRRGVDGLLVPGTSVVHRLPAQCKVAALVAFAAVVVSVPAGEWGALGALGALAVGLVVLARLPVATVAGRMVVEVPFVVLALTLPLVAAGPRVDLGPLTVSGPGLSAGAALLAKATLGVLVAVVLASTTAPRDLLGGLARLRLPAALLAVLSFTLRYVGVVSGDLARQRTARELRGASGRRLAHLPAVAAGVGTVFVRTYERGERVHRAMLVRSAGGAAGAGGLLDLLDGAPAGPRAWLTAAVLPAAGLAVVLLGTAR